MDIQKPANKTPVPKRVFQEDIVKYVQGNEITIDMVDELGHLNASTGKLIDIDSGEAEEEPDEPVIQSTSEGTGEEEREDDIINDDDMD